MKAIELVQLQRGPGVGDISLPDNRPSGALRWWKQAAAALR
jgi:hypothetical protein